MAAYIEIEPGSALERMVGDKPFSEAVHKMAELLERVMRENWMPPLVQGPPGDPELTSLLADEVHHRTGNIFHIVEPDGLTVRQVDEEGVLRLARDQYPAGLEPIGLDDGDEEIEEPFDRHDDAGHGRTDAQAAPAPDEEDLSHLA